MEEERKEINEDEKEIVKAPDEEYLKLKKSNSKKNVIIILLVFVVIIMLALALLYYFNNKDTKQGEGNNPISTSTPIPSTPEPTENEQSSTPEPVGNTLSNDEAIKIAKEKIKMANKFSNENKCFEENRELEKGTRWCYYGSLDDFKNTFYGIYSSKLVYKDVMNEYKSITGDGADWSTNVKLEGDMLDSIPGYVISNNKYYRDSCTIGSGTYSSVAKFTVDSITMDKIKLNYVVMEKEPDVENAKETEREKATIILVKEDNDWKILKATISDMCNGVYTVGKES